MNATKQSKTGTKAQELLLGGLEVHAEMALEEPECRQGVDEDLLELVNKHGLNSVLEAIQCAAWGAGEVHADHEDLAEAMASVRLKLFGSRIADAMNALK